MASPRELKSRRLRGSRIDRGHRGSRFVACLAERRYAACRADLGVCFTQPTPTQIKVGPINFWPQGKGGGGRLHIDGCAKPPEQGWDAFIKILQRHGLTRPLK